MPNEFLGLIMHLGITVLFMIACLKPLGITVVVEAVTPNGCWADLVFTPNNSIGPLLLRLTSYWYNIPRGKNNVSYFSAYQKQQNDVLLDLKITGR